MRKLWRYSHHDHHYHCVLHTCLPSLQRFKGLNRNATEAEVRARRNARDLRLPNLSLVPCGVPYNCYDASSACVLRQVRSSSNPERMSSLGQLFARSLQQRRTRTRRLSAIINRRGVRARTEESRRRVRFNMHNPKLSSIA